MLPGPLPDLSPKQLLQLTGEIIDELIARGICRTANNPLSDYTEWLVANRYCWVRAPNSEQGYDAEDPATKQRYEIKGRRVSKKNKSRQLGAIRDLEGNHFQFLIAVIYDEHFHIEQVLKIPHCVVGAIARKSSHTNSWILVVNSTIAQPRGVEDITEDFVSGVNPPTPDVCSGKR